MLGLFVGWVVGGALLSHEGAGREGVSGKFKRSDCPCVLGDVLQKLHVKDSCESQVVAAEVTGCR